MAKVKRTKKNVEEEEKLFFHDVLTPELAKLQAEAEDWIPPEMPEYDGDPLDLTPEQEAEICKLIRKSRGHDDDSE